jgi:SAM-dependent methyltransferase
MSNYDSRTVSSFGNEWTRYDQSGLPEDERVTLFEAYFRLFPWSEVGSESVGFDLGCGSGRWAQLVAPRVGHLHCVDPSGPALDVARRNLSGLSNCDFHQAPVDAIPLPDSSMDFGYSLGVLHHVPDPDAGLLSCVKKLKPGGIFLLYVYYAMDNRPVWFKSLWRLSDHLRRLISTTPPAMRHLLTDIAAACVYWPAAKIARAVEITGLDPDFLPLAAYRRRSFYTMRTDALDRFGTPLEQRFTSERVQAMMAAAGLVDVRISESPPYWCAVGRRAGRTAQDDTKGSVPRRSRT